jgi:hypothetical protein
LACKQSVYGRRIDATVTIKHLKRETQPFVELRLRLGVQAADQRPHGEVLPVLDRRAVAVLSI